MIARLALVLTLILGGALARAQEMQGPALIGPPMPSAPAQAPIAPITGPDYGAWALVAARAEQMSEQAVASVFAIDRQRVILVDWRDRFLAAEDQNAARIGTVKAQLAALGAAPDAGTEPADVAKRRADLETQLARLTAPAQLAQEAYVQANGLIGELDALMRSRETRRLTTRGTVPLDPANWPAAMTALKAGFVGIYAETTAALRSGQRYEAFKDARATILIYALLSLVLLRWGVRWMGRAQDWARRRIGARGGRVWDFLISIGWVILPWAGIWFFAEAVLATGYAGYRGGAIVASLPNAALYLLIAAWFARHFAPQGGGHSVLGLTTQASVTARRLLLVLAAVLAAGVVYGAFLDRIEMSDNARTVLVLPYQVVLGLALFRVGMFLVGAGRSAVAEGRNRLLPFVARASVAVAVLGPLLSAAGYGAASAAVMTPAILTLAVLATLILLQRLVFDLYALATGLDDGANDALLPVLAGFVLFFAALPPLALIWGAREADLQELWTRFREGFSIGATRISPTEFLTFAVVFGLGYTLTRLVQGTLRSAVLPKTRLDVGGQHAITAGVGYVGLFVAAVAAITSAGIDLSNLAIVAGALSVGIGFGLQTIVSNFVSGIILLIERPISEGDWIEVGGHMGYVRDISVRATRIETFDRTDVIIPNADLVAGQVTNWTRGNSVGRVIVPVGVAYGTDAEKVMKILTELAEAHPMVMLSPPPAVYFIGFGADSLDFEIRAIVRDVNFSMVIKSEVNLAISKRFAAEGIEIPFAQRDIHLRNPEALRAVLNPGKDQA